MPPGSPPYHLVATPHSFFQLCSTSRAPDAPLTLIWPCPGLLDGQVFGARPDEGQRLGNSLLSVQAEQGLLLGGNGWAWWG